MQLNTYLSFNGNCEEAFKVYEKCLGGNIQTMMRWGESPMADQVPSEWRNKVIHATLMVGEEAILGADSPPDRYEEPKGFSVAIQLKDVAEAERIFQTLSEKGKVQMELQQTFWAARFGMVVDRFGTPWMINCENAAQ